MLRWGRSGTILLPRHFAGESAKRLSGNPSNTRPAVLDPGLWQNTAV